MFLPHSATNRIRIWDGNEKTSWQLAYPSESPVDIDIARRSVGLSGLRSLTVMQALSALADRNALCEPVPLDRQRALPECLGYNAYVTPATPSLTALLIPQLGSPCCAYCGVPNPGGYGASALLRLRLVVSGRPAQSLTGDGTQNAWDRPGLATCQISDWDNGGCVPPHPHAPRESTESATKRAGCKPT